MANLRILFWAFLDSFLRVFVIVGLIEFVVTRARRQQWPMYFAPALFLAALFSFYAFVVTVGSGAMGFTRSGMSTIPFLLVIAIDTFHRNVRSRAVVVLTIVVMFLFSFQGSLRSAREALRSNARLGHQLAGLSDILEDQRREANQERVVVMTRNPWEVYHSTRQSAIQIPNGDLDTIFEVAQRFGANYLLLPAPRQALRSIYRGDTVDGRFEFVAEVPGTDMKVYRIKPADR